MIHRHIPGDPCNESCTPPPEPRQLQVETLQPDEKPVPYAAGRESGREPNVQTIPRLVDPHDPEVRLEITWDDAYESGRKDGYADGKGWCRRHGDKNPFRAARPADVVTQREADIYRRGYEHGQRKPLAALRRLLGALANDETGDETRDADRAARALVDDIDDKRAARWILKPSREDIDGPPPVQVVRSEEPSR